MAKTRDLLIPGIGFTLFVTLFFLAMLLRLGIGINTSLLLTAAWGVMTALLVASGYVTRAYLQRHAFHGKKQAHATTAAHQQRTLDIDVPFEVAFDLALDALKTLDAQAIPVADVPLIKWRVLVRRTQHLRLDKTNRTIGRIEAALRAKQVGITDVIDFSKMTVQLQRLDAHTTRIHIESQPASIFDAYDMGKNLHYVNHLALYLRRESQHYHAAGRLQATDADEDSPADERASDQADSATSHL